MEAVSLYDMSSEASVFHYEKLEAGNVLFIDHLPVNFLDEDFDFLRGQRQSGAVYRKDIAYGPLRDVLTGAARGAAKSLR
jgi:3-deoxy-D-manno-oct-2-ulosonic acid (Kdo) hydroxylase